MKKATRADKVTFTGLRPGTRYSYDFKVNGETVEGSFETAPAGPARFQFVVYGDTRSRHEVHQQCRGRHREGRTGFRRPHRRPRGHGRRYVALEKIFCDRARTAPAHGFLPGGRQSRAQQRAVFHVPACQAVLLVRLGVGAFHHPRHGLREYSEQREVPAGAVRVAREGPGEKPARGPSVRGLPPPALQRDKKAGHQRGYGEVRSALREVQGACRVQRS